MRNGFRDLIVWQKAYTLTLEIYKISRQFPREEMYSLTSQIRRAALSIPANIAEGYERRHRKEYIQFLSIAKGSLGELETYLLLVRDLRYVEVDICQKLEESRKEIAKIIVGLIRSII